MTSGRVTTIRAGQKSDKPEPELHRILMRNATVQDLAQGQVERIGRTFQADGRYYRIAEIYRDTLNRLIAVGVLIDGK